MKTLVFTLLFVATCSAVDFSERASNFSIELLHYTQLEKEGHVVISPFGIWTLMTGVALGATGESEKQLLRAFFLPRDEADIVKGYRDLTKTVLDPRTSDVKLASKNFMFLDRGFEVYNTFKSKMVNDFGAMVNILNFADPNSAARDANSIIQGSGAMVSNVLKSTDFKESRMILTNAISFKGLWMSPFNKSETTLESFYDEQRNLIGKVNMMYQRAEFAYSSMPSMKSLIVELPYGKDKKYCMLLILPHHKVSVADVYKKFASVSFKDIFAKLQKDVDEYGFEEIEVKLPRFKISTNVVLNSPLNNMGVYDIFDQVSASFKKVSSESIYVSAIVHKADIEVTESGTVASASTSAYFADRISTPTFNADRPFLYFVMEKPTATVIFSGIYSKPSVF
ncbi:serine protease inhibitor 77Ba-like [Leptidea sinapis]|uniref:serine protease inhibitor 77Ba-like n=1 Tax=Leptidea sinapis TaxID=189913 RepID=UPI0021C41509|nr:serine protease inhibitor 77Ba-like [Leptidea sinapis]